MITGTQCRAARALVEYSRERLASFSGVDVETISNFEHKLATPTKDELAALQSVLEEGGAVFIAENGGGFGVRLKFSRSETKRIATLESEGGITARDDVP